MQILVNGSAIFVCSLAAVFYLILAIAIRGLASRETFLRLFDHPRKPSTGRVVQPLDGLRGLAISMVVCFHTFQWINPAFGELGHFQLVRSGWSGVELFVVLSGYLIYGTLAKYEHLRWRDIGEYFKRRILRIYPVYLATTMAGFLVAMAGALIPFAWYQGGLAVADQHGLVGTLLAQLVLLRGIDWSIDTVFNPPAWSLGVEFSFYLVAPLYVLLTKRRTFWIPLAVMLLLFLTRGTASREWGIFYFFFVGIAIYELLPLIRKMPERVVWMLFGVCLLSLLYFWNYWFVDMQGHHLFSRSYRTGFLAAGYAGLVIAAIRLKAIERLLAWYPLRFIGIISYSLFLWHFFILAAVAQMGLPQLGMLEAGLTMLLLVLPATLMVAMLSYVAIEKPFMRVQGDVKHVFRREG